MIGIILSVNTNKLVGKTDGSSIDKLQNNSGDNPDIKEKTIIGFVNFQELTILELSSHQGNVLAYPNYDKNNDIEKT